MTRFKHPSSIRTTLLLLLLPSAILFMGLSWVVHGLLLDRMTQNFVQQRLVEEADFLEELLTDDQPFSENPVARAGKYFQSIFHHAFAIQSAEHKMVSPESWRSALQPLLDLHQTGFAQHSFQLPSEQKPRKLLIYRRTIQHDNQSIQLLVAEDLTQLDLSQQELHLWTAFVALGLLLVLIAMIYAVVNLSLRSSRSLQKSLQALQQGERQRLEPENLPHEFAPLVHQLNQLLKTLEQRLWRSREAISNLSHSIKTPIAAVQQMLEDQHSPLTMEQRTQMALRLKEVHHQLEKEMRRSHFAGPQAGQNARPVLQARDLLWVLGRLYPDKHFEMDISVETDSYWPVEEQDMNELLGNLLDNAGKWAKSRILLKLATTPENLEIHIQDDGSGVDPRNLQELGTRGLRLDEQKPGYGLGLAIVHEIVTRYDGRLIFSNNHGLMASIYLPRKIS